MTPAKTGAPSKPKPKKWQFGIRSRNAPYEAMKCLYNALEAQGAEWEVIPALAYDGDGNSEEEGSMPPPPQLANGERHTILQSKFPHMPRDYYVPRDPWFIRARMLKRGMFHPGEGPAFSAQNSSANLAAEQFKNRVEQEGGYVGEDLAKIGSSVNDATSNSNPGSQPGSGHPTRPNSSVGENAAAGQDAYTGPGQLPSRVSSMLSSLGREPNPDIGVWVFIDIQLYMLESQTYMVDFKCDGYQNVHFVEVDSTRSPQTGSSSRLTSPAVSRPASGLNALRHSDSMNGDRNDHEHSDTSWTGRVGDWRPVSKRYKGKEKEITSPYPYLDVASDLIAQLAVQN
jgi:carbon catabolite-derepressing protein kinase